MADVGAPDLTRAQKVVERIVGRSPVTRTPMDTMGETPLLQDEPHFPPAPWTRARHNKQHGQAFPQAIAHRGYRARFPENSMAAFRGAVSAGVHAIETDVHLTRDGVVVLSHDATLKRCFGRPQKLSDVDWADVAELETLTGEPRQRMARLADLLEYLASPGLEELWILLDIKLDNDGDEMLRRIAATVSAAEAPAPGTGSDQGSDRGSDRGSAPAQGRRPWRDRVVLGIWASKYIPLCAAHLPGFPVAHIGFSTSYAAQFLEVPNVGFNMLQPVLVGPLGASFVRRARRAQRGLLAWTVNDERNMRWCIRKGVDGVIADDPKRFLDMCEHWAVERHEPAWALGQLWSLLRTNVVVFVFGMLFRIRFGSGLEAQGARKKR